MTMERIERTLARSPVAETMLNVFKAALSTAPFTGGLASLITDYIPSSRFRRLEEFAQRAGIDERRITGGFADMFRTVLPGMDLDLVKSAFGDLYQSGLISTDKTIFGTMTSAQGLQLLGDRVTPLGHRFMRFVKTPTGN